MVEINYKNINSLELEYLSPLELFESFLQKLLQETNFDLNSYLNEIKKNFDKQKNYKISFQTHEEKNSFYDCTEELFQQLLDLNLSLDSSSLVVSSFLEIVDNAFTHNLGRWPTPHYKRVASIFINDISKKKFTIAVGDIGIGFKKTLKLKYPELISERDAIKLAIKPNISSRPTDYKGQKMGGNGLYFLQKNIFNGLSGRLFIRSCNCFCEILSANQIQELESDLPFKYGANVFFELSYA